LPVNQWLASGKNIMESSRKKVLEKMHRGLISYKLLGEGWDVCEHFGDGYDLIAEKNGKSIKIELKAVDLNSIKKGKNATQHISANELVTSTHLIVTVFQDIELLGNYIMSIRQFVENSGVKKYNKYSSYNAFLIDYRQLSKDKSEQVKNSGKKIERLDFDLSFNPNKIEKWKFYKFKNQWKNLEKG